MWFPTVMSITLQAESQKIEVDAWDLKGSAGILDFFCFFLVLELLFFLVYFRATLAACGGSQARG